MENNYSQDTDEKDLAVLLESLKSFETLDPRTLREIFEIIRSLLSKNKKAQNNFRKLQGIALLVNMYQYYNKTKNSEMIGRALYTLGEASEQNDVTRNVLMSPEIFTMVKGSAKLSLVPSAFLLLSLTSNNVAGQDLSRTTHCLNKICSLLKTYLTEQLESNEILVYCDALCTTICAMISNPVNNNNQEVCCRLLLPTLVTILYQDINRKILQSLIKVMGSCIIDNSNCQKNLCVIGGIRALATLLLKCLSFDTEEGKAVADKAFMMHLINTLSCSYTNNSANKVQAIELDIIENLLNCLQTYTIYGRDCGLQITCVSALLNLFDEPDNSVAESGQRRFQESGGIAVLIELLTTQDEKLKKMLTALLPRTFNKEALPASGKKNNTTSMETTKRSHIVTENEDCEVSSSDPIIKTPSNNLNAVSIRHQNTDDHNHGKATVNKACCKCQDKSHQRKSNGQKEKMGVTRSDSEKCAKRPSNNKHTEDKTAEKSANHTTVEYDYQQVPLTQRKATQNIMYSISQTTKDCDQTAKRVRSKDMNVKNGTDSQKVIKRSLDSQTAVNDGIDLHAYKEHYITPKKRANSSLTDRSASIKQKKSNRLQQRALAYKVKPITDIKPGQEECSVKSQEHMTKSTDTFASINTRRITRSMRHCNVYLDDQGMDMELSPEHESGPEEVYKAQVPKGKHRNVNTRLGRSVPIKSTVERSHVNGYRNTPLSECFSSSENEAGASPISKQKNTTKLTQTSAVNGGTPLSSSHSLHEEEAKATLGTKQISSVNDHTLLGDYYSLPEMTADEISSSRRERVAPMSKSDDDLCCVNVPYVDSHNILEILCSDMACDYHRHLGHELSRYLAQMLSQ